MEKENSTAFYSHPMGFEFASLSLSLSLIWTRRLVFLSFSSLSLVSVVYVTFFSWAFRPWKERQSDECEREEKLIKIVQRLCIRSGDHWDPSMIHHIFFLHCHSVTSGEAKAQGDNVRIISQKKKKLMKLCCNTRLSKMTLLILAIIQSD